MAASALLRRIVDPGRSRLVREKYSFCLDTAMERRRRNNYPTLDMSDINGLLAKQAQEVEQEAFPKYGSADEFYDLHEEIGKGAYGIVKKCVDKATGKHCAAKIVTTSNSNLRKETMREIEMMRILGRHKKLVGLLDAYHTPFEIVMILEFVEGGELFERIIEEDYLMEEDAISYVHQTLQALEFMHSKNIVHLDLKPENIMCESTDSNQIKLVDFGLARQLKDDEEVKSSFGTPDFVAPEVIRMKPVSKASDMWSLGVVTYVMLSGLMPFSGENDHDTLVKVAKADWDFDDDCFDEVSEDAKDFIEGLLVKEPSERYTIEECMDLPWLKAEHQMGKIDTKKLRSFFAKRRWKKSINALVAVRRMSLSPLAMRARRGSMPMGASQNKKKLEEDTDRKASFPAHLSKTFPKRSFTEPKGPRKYPGKLTVNSRESSIDETEESDSSVMLRSNEGQRVRSHTFSGDISVPSRAIIPPKVNINENQGNIADNAQKIETTEINNNEKTNGIREQGNEKSALVITKENKEFSHVGHVVLNIDTQELANGKVKVCLKDERTPNMSQIRSQTTEENHVILTQQFRVQMEEGLRIRTKSFNDNVPSIVVNNDSGLICSGSDRVLVSTTTTTEKRVVCTTETMQTRTADAHALLRNTTDHTTSCHSSYTFRTVDPKGQTITVKLDGMNSLELPVDRDICNHLRRASTGSEAIEMLKTIKSKLG